MHEVSGCYFKQKDLDGGVTTGCFELDLSNFSEFIGGSFLSGVGLDLFLHLEGDAGAPTVHNVYCVFVRYEMV